MTKKSSTPAIRFKGFTDTWEQRKLGDIGETYTGLSGKTKADFGHGQARFVTYMNVFSNPISNPEMTEPIEIDPKQNEVEVGDVLFTTSSETPEEVGMSSVLLEKRGKTYLNSFCFGFRPSEKIDSYYLAYMLRSESAREKIILLAQGISRYNISKNKVMEIAVSLPSLDEQKLIGQYFRQLDNLITLHQRKFEKLTNVKKSMLEKLFPQNGSSYPEIRFKGFTDPWEQRKLGDIGKARSGVGFPDADQGGLTGVPFFKVSDMNSDGNENEMTVANNYVTAEQIADHRWSPITELPAIFFAKVGAAVMLNRKRLCRFPFLLDNNTMAYSLSPTKWDADFAKALFGTVDLTSLVQVGALPSYNAGDVESMEIYLPSLLEQEQIGAYFKHLDHLITLHQRQPFLHSTPEISLTVQLIHPFYTSSWEQRKAIDIADYSKGNGYSKGDLADAGTPIILYGRLYTKYQFAISEVDTFAVPRNGAVYSQGNEVIVPASGETAEDIARASAVEKSGVLLGGDLNILRPFDFMNPLFLALAISNGEPQKELAKKAQGKSVVHIHNTDIQEVTIAYPSKTEQDRIVSVFRQLDNLITLHQRELEKLQNIKKSMLEKMFV